MAFESLQNGLLGAADKIESNKYLTSIKNAFTVFVPFIVVGSFGSLLNTLIAGGNGLAKWIPALSKLSPAFTMMNFATISCMTLPIAFLIAVELGRREELPRMICGTLGVISYLMVCPNTISVMVDGLENAVTAGGLGQGVIGAQGLFVAMLMSVLAVEFLKVLMRIDAIKIKMPPSVPAGIAASFNTLVPIFIVSVVFSVVGNLFYLATGNYLNVWLYEAVQIPLQAAANSTAGVIVLAFANQIFWFLGIHGGMVIEPVRGPLSAAGIAENIAAVEAGAIAANPLTRGFWTSFVVVGGGGITLSLLIAIFLFSKRDDYKAIAKLGFIPGICGINEPVVFGLPMVLNPVFAIPFICNSAVAAAIALIFTKIGFIACGVVDCPPGLPVFVTAGISYGWHGAVVQMVILAVTFFIWLPFVLISNKQPQADI